MQSSEAHAIASGDVLETVRVFDAPRTLVWRLWTDPAHRVRWWGPEGYALSHCEVDLRVGGAWSIAMRRVDGYEHRVCGVFRTISEPGHLSFTYVNEDDGIETLVTLDFADLGGRTEMRFRQAPFADAGTRDAHRWGWASSFGLLADYAARVVAAGGKHVGQPRIEGEAPDIVAARTAHQDAGKLPNDGK